jgi:soluble lytic murein transglycosylase-like protein
MTRTVQAGWLVCAALLLALPAAAAEFVLLDNGFRLHADHHEVAGSTVRVYEGDCVAEFPLARVAAFEAVEIIAAPATESAPAAPPEAVPLDPKELVTRAAIRNGLEPKFLHSIAAVESGYRQDAVSSKGAIGIMQLMPQTARALQADPADPEQNVDAGARYLRELLIKYLDDPYQVRKALAAYNAGPAAVDRFDGIPPFPETQRYVRKVLQRHAALTQ